MVSMFIAILDQPATVSMQQQAWQDLQKSHLVLVLSTAVADIARASCRTETVDLGELLRLS